MAMYQRLCRVWIVYLVASVMLGGCETRRSSSQPARELTGKEIYSYNCASCHGGNLQGGFGPSLSEVGRRLTEQDVVDILHNGRGSMRPQLHLPEPDKKRLAEWLVSSTK